MWGSGLHLKLFFFLQEKLQLQMKLQESEQRLGLLKLSDTTDAVAAKRSKFKVFFTSLWTLNQWMNYVVKILLYMSVFKIKNAWLIIIKGESKVFEHHFISKRKGCPVTFDSPWWKQMRTTLRGVAGCAVLFHHIEMCTTPPPTVLPPPAAAEDKKRRRHLNAADLPVLKKKKKKLQLIASGDAELQQLTVRRNTTPWWVRSRSHTAPARWRRPAACGWWPPRRAGLRARTSARRNLGGTCSTEPTIHQELIQVKCSLKLWSHGLKRGQV